MLRPASVTNRGRASKALVFNARVSVYLADLTAWGKNVNDEVYMIQNQDNLSLGARVHGALRTYRFTATEHFE